MNIEDIKKYASLMDELSLTGLEVNEDGCTVRLEKGGSIVPSAPVQKAETYKVEAKEDKPEGKIITSPMVGVFYTSPAENAEPYVNVGQKVRSGDTLCLIEAMKLMNEINAEEDGTIAEVLQKNGTVVGFGTPLFRMIQG